MTVKSVYKDTPHCETVYAIGMTINGSRVKEMHEVFGVRHSVQVYLENGEMRNVYDPDEVFYSSK